MPTSTHACRLAVALASILSCAPAMAGSVYDITVQQVGDNVVFTGSGSVDLTGLTEFSTSSNGGGVIRSDFSLFAIGTTGDGDFYSVLSGPSSAFVSPNNFHSASSNTGAGLEVQGSGGILGVPEGYTSGTDLGTSTSTYDNTTIAGLGLIPGTYNWTWADGDITLTIPSVPVPEPATLALLGLPLAVLLLARRGRPISR